MPTKDSGRFVINDIELNIPPQQISIKSRQHNDGIQALRTSGSHKVRSGQSQTTITIVAKFTDTNKGLLKLRDLIAQFRVTPFCYVENQYLRNSILSGDTEQAMALALSNMSISKGNDTTNCLDVVMHFYWFHYFPYTKNFTFKKEMFGITEVNTPSDSDCWKLLTAAEKRRRAGKYFGDKAVYQDIGKLSNVPSNIDMTFPQYALMKAMRYNQLKKDVKALRDLKEKLQIYQSGDNDFRAENANAAVYQSLLEELNDPARAKALHEEFFGNTTTVGKDEADIVSELLETINNTIGPGTASRYQPVIEDWKTIILADGKSVRPVETLARTAKDENTVAPDENLLLVKDITLQSEKVGLIPQTITISFNNILAPMALVGHPYPTFQHTGGGDAVVSITFATTKEYGVKAISNFKNIYETQSTKFRSIPVGQRNIHITNPIINMCGLKEFVLESLDIDTVPGTTDTSQITMTLRENPIDSQTREHFMPSLGMLTNFDIRRRIAKVMEDNLQLVENAVEEQTNWQGKFHRFKARNLEDIVLSEQKRIVTRSRSTVFLNNYATSYYVYTGPNDSDGRNDGFKNLCEEYGNKLGTLFASVVGIVSSNRVQISERKKVREAMNRFFNASSGDGFSIPKLVNDIKSVVKFKRTTTPTTEIKNPTVGKSLAGDLKAEVDVEELAKLLDEWNTWALDFIDNKVLLPGRTALPEFAEVQKLMAKSVVESSSGHAYPDFPLKEVVNIMRDSGDKGLSLAIEKLTSVGLEKQFHLKNLSIASLIGPDFYFFNNHRDSLFSIIGADAISKATQSITDAQNHMRSNVERTWFADEYEPNILGTGRSEIVKSSIERMLHDKKSLPKYWDEGDGKGEDAAKKKAIRDAIQLKLNKAVADHVAPDYLEGEIKPSILATQRDQGNIKIAPINVEKDGDNISTNRHDGAVLQPSETSNKLVHRYGIESLEYLASSLSTDVYTVDDVEFGWPTEESTRRISSPFGWREHPIRKERQFHQGIDLVGLTSGGCDGDPVLAAADGKISWVTANFDPERQTGGGFVIQITHASGYTSQYMHLKWDAMSQDLHRIFNNWGVDPNTSGTPLTQSERDMLLTVYKGQHIANIGSTGGSTGPHLHFQIKKGKEAIDPISILAGENISSVGPLTGINPRNESLITKSVEQFEKSLLNGQGYSMARAFPTYRMYFIESDLGERKRFGFDDFFSYSSVVDIQVIRSRKIPVDLAVVKLTNISGIFGRRIHKDRKSSEYIPQENDDNVAENANSPEDRNTERENPLRHLMLKPGTQVELRMGYNSDPEELPIVFTGFISDTQFVGESDELVEITCQGWQAELVQSIYGQVKKFGGFMSDSGRTSTILQQVMAMPDCVHFGRWEPGTSVNQFRGLISSKWQLRPRPADDNIFAPTGSSILGMWDTTPKYIMYNSTIWDVIQEMTYRHPSLVASAVPYRDKYGTRMTMFFGLPDQLYLARDPSFKEDLDVDNLKSIVNEAVGEFSPQEQRKINLENKDVSIDSQEIRDAIGNEEVSEDAIKYWVDHTVKNFALNKGIIRPFRSYHILSSTLHILQNNIRSSSYNTFNTVTLQYSDDNPSVNESTGNVEFGDLSTFTQVADAAIPDEDKREMLAQFPNCVGYEMAKMYSLSMLWNSLKDTYQGNVTIMGNPEIKPYDICVDGNTLILTNKGYKRIKDINIGDMVYSHRGVLRKVDQTFKRPPVEEVYDIKCKTNPDHLVITGNHPVLSVKREEVFDKWGARKKDTVSTVLPIFRRIDELTSKDYLAEPRIKSKHSLHPSLAQLFGYYLAEGSIIWEYRKSFNKRYGKRQYEPYPVKCCKVPVAVKWSFNSITESFMIDKINNLINDSGFTGQTSSYFNKNRNGVDIVFYNRDFVNLVIKECGFSDNEEHKENKWMRRFFDEETTKYILGSYYNGDGSINTGKRSFALNAGTTSMTLGRNIRQMLINIGIPVCSNISLQYNKIQKKKIRCWYNDISRSYSDRLLSYTWYKTDKNNRFTGTPTNVAFVDDLYVYTPIDSMTKTKLDTVYNIGVEIDNTYIASSKTVHNCYLLDEYTDQFGPIEVEQVVHRFNSSGGFTTEIVPDMVIHVNQKSTMATSDAMGLIAEHAISAMGLQSLPSIMEGSGKITSLGGAVNAAGGAVLSAVTAAMVPFDFAFGIASRLTGIGSNTAIAGNNQNHSVLRAAGAFIFRKLITRTQMAHPFRYSPLVYRGKPMIGGLPNSKTDGSFIQGIGTWFKELGESNKLYAEDLYDRFFDVNNWVGHSRGDFGDR